MYVPNGPQIIFMLELPGDLQKVRMSVLCPMPLDCNLIHLKCGLGSAVFKRSAGYSTYR